LEEASRNDILVFPTKFEGFPVALLEAMSMGCVPVVTDLPGGIREVVENGVTGYKCAIDKNEEFVTAIETLHSNRTLLHQMKLNDMELVRKNYDVKKTGFTLPGPVHYSGQ
jgi:glycosyltransferase involved in cell wall biosynthesis